MQCANLGGMEQASLRQMRGLIERGHNFEVLSLNPIGPLGPLLKQAGIPAQGLTYGGRCGWKTWLPLRRELQSRSPDALLMTGHNLMAQLALGNCCSGRRVLAIHFHHAGVKPAWQWRCIYRLACKQFRWITFPTGFIREEAEQLYGPVAKIAKTIRYPIALPELPTKEQKLKARACLGLPSDAQIVGNAGWLIPRKRFDVFLRTVAQVMKVRPNVRAVIAGDGEERTRLEQLASELGIAERVHWLGWVQNMAQFYHSLDLLVFNSDWDALGMTPLEAMSYQIPVVASVVNGGLKEIISSEEYGSLLPAHDIEALAANAVRLLSSASEAATVGLAARERVRITSNPETVAAEYDELLSPQ